MMKNITKYSLLFFSLYICSIIVINILLLVGAEFKNSSNTAFIATLTALIFLFFIKYCISRKVEKN